VQVVCPAGPGNARNSEGDIIELKDGRLLLAWSKFIGPADDAEAVIAGKTSTDGGKTWGNEYVVQENVGKRNVMSVSFLRSISGQILLFYGVKNGPSDLLFYVRSSDDEARHWSEPIRVTTDDGYHVMNNDRVIQLRSGRLIAPVAFCPSIDTQYEEQKSICYLSDDGGLSWRKSRGEVGLDRAAAMEPGVVELKDGRVLMIIRTRLDRVYQSFSDDGAETWSRPQPTDLVAPAAPASITRIPTTQDLLIIWNNNPRGNAAGWQGRTPLTSAISKDEGTTWTCFRNLEDDPNCGFGYTSITWVKDRALLTYYKWAKGSPNFQNTDLILRIVPVEWFRDEG
jgi:sialidase-1